MNKALSLKPGRLHRGHIALMIALLFAAFVLVSSIVHHVTGMNLANWLMSQGFYWAYANWLAGAAVGILEDGGAYVLSIEVPVLAPIAILLAALLATYGAGWLIVW